MLLNRKNNQFSSMFCKFRPFKNLKHGKKRRNADSETPRKPRKWEGAGSTPQYNFRSSDGERKQIPGTESQKSYRAQVHAYGSSKNATH